MHPSGNKNLNAWLRYSTIGIEFAAWIVVCAFIGYGLDRYLQPSIPWGTLGFSLTGIFLAIWRLIRRIDELSRK